MGNIQMYACVVQTRPQLWGCCAAFMMYLWDRHCVDRVRPWSLPYIYIYICMYIANSLLFGFLRAIKSMELFLHTLGAHSNSGHWFLIFTIGHKLWELRCSKLLLLHLAHVNRCENFWGNARDRRLRNISIWKPPFAAIFIYATDLWQLASCAS